MLAHPIAYIADLPREGCMAVGGLTEEDALPVVVLIDMNEGWAFHSQRYEQK